VDKLRSRAVAEALDIGSADMGRTHNLVDRYRCPRCGGRMLRMVDPQQPHIWYEQCAECYGSYFDAGEFVDLATVSLSDLLRRFRTTARE